MEGVRGVRGGKEGRTAEPEPSTTACLCASASSTYI
jgi:hypothetical protein